MSRPSRRAGGARPPAGGYARAVALVEFRGVKKAFGPKQVYRGLDLDMNEGESLTIIGGSGQGKSVMLKMLIGLLGVDEGTITFDGEVISGGSEANFARVRRSIGMLFQGAALFDSLSVKENVAYGLREQFTSMGEDEIDERVEESLTYVGLPGTGHMAPSDLSTGMRKRVGLARAIAVRPRVLLYDEPTTGLDPINVSRINQLIVHLKNTLNVTSVVVTHDVSTVFTVSDRIAMVNQGYIIFSGTKADLAHAKDPVVRNFIEGNAPENEDTATLLRSAG